MYSFYNGFLFFIVFLFLLWSSTLSESKIRNRFLQLGFVLLILLFIYYIYFNVVRSRLIKEGFDINEFNPSRQISDMYQFQLQKMAEPIKNIPTKHFSQKVVIDDSKNIRLVPKTTNCTNKLNGILIFKLEEFIYFVSIQGNKKDNDSYILNNDIPESFIVPDSIYYYSACDISSLNPNKIYVYSINNIENFVSNNRKYPDYLLGSLDPSEVNILKSRSIKINNLAFTTDSGYSVFQPQEPKTGYILSGWSDKKNDEVANLSPGQDIIIVFDIHDLGYFFTFNKVSKSPETDDNIIYFTYRVPEIFLNDSMKFKIYNGSKPSNYPGGNEDIYFFKKDIDSESSPIIDGETKNINTDDKSKKDTTPNLETHCYSCFSTNPKKIYYKIDQSGNNVEAMGITLPDSSYNKECSEFPLSLFGTDAIKCSLSDNTVNLTNSSNSEDAIEKKYGINQVLDGDMNFKEPLKLNSSVVNKTQTNKTDNTLLGEDVDVDSIKKPTTLNINVAYYTRDGGNMDTLISENDTEIKDNQIRDNDTSLSYSQPNENNFVFDSGLNKNNQPNENNQQNENQNTNSHENQINQDLEPNKVVEHIKAVRNDGNVTSSEKDCALDSTCNKINKEEKEKVQKSFDNHNSTQKNNWNVGNNFNNQYTNQSGVVLGGSTCGSEGANYFCRYSYLPINPAFYRPVADIMDNHNGVSSSSGGYSVFPSNKKWLDNNKSEVNKYKDFYNNYYKNVNEMRYKGIEGK